MQRILRVFPKQTSYTPIDKLTYYPNGLLQAPMWELFPEFGEIHISCSFTWDKAFCRKLQEEWQVFTDKPVKLGGPAFGSVAEDFTPGLYLKPNIIFTSRGCNNNCPWCIVPKIEGKLKELPIVPGNIIQDNNFLQTSSQHKEKVFEMLRTQHGICFKGGLQASLIDDHFVENIQSLKIKELWLAADTDASLPALKKACNKLKKAGFNQEKVKCYVLIGHDIAENWAKEHPVRTYKSAFLEKFPDAELGCEDGAPYVCLYYIFGLKHAPDYCKWDSATCFKCWNREVEE